MVTGPDPEIDDNVGTQNDINRDKHRQGAFLLTEVASSDSIESQILNAAKAVIDVRRNNYLMNMKQSGESHVDNRKIGSDLLKERRLYQGKNIASFYADEGGLVITYANASYLYDINGNEYLDCCNNVACVGHSEPSVVKAGCDALSMIQTNSRFLHPTQQRYIQKLLSTFPPELNVVYLVNSGSEANDLALRIAKAQAEIKCVARKPRDVICLDSGAF